MSPNVSQSLPMSPNVYNQSNFMPNHHPQSVDASDAEERNAAMSVLSEALPHLSYNIDAVVKLANPPKVSSGWGVYT